MLINKHFTKSYTPLTTATRDVTLADAEGQPIFQRNVLAPTSWSDRAVLIAASKYMRGEPSIEFMISRVVNPIVKWGREDGYFTPAEADLFRYELTHILITQRASFNSPVWFNVGFYDEPQVSACFILHVADTMDSLLQWNHDEGMIFKGGSGSGTNLSLVRSKHETLSGRGHASGPVSFMKGADAWAGVIKSGGKTRRAAKMVILDADHPDILDFINCKVHEEAKAQALISAGYSPAIDGEAYQSVAYQNANNSVRVTDGFMQLATTPDAEWHTTLRTTGEVHAAYTAPTLLRQMAEAAYLCGDPGLQFHDTINRWHTCPEAGPIRASNPCSEYFHLDETACNLASLNLAKFVTHRRFLLDDFKHTADTIFTAMDIMLDHASYPTPAIAANVKRYRELGLGYANLGATLMTLGLPYDSDDGRSFAAAVTALLGAASYCQSALIGRLKGAAEGLEPEAQERVLSQHRDAALSLSVTPSTSELVGPIIDEAAHLWQIAVGDARRMRNTQATVLAPTGTISFLMDCDSTGIEPLPLLIADKQLVGGGTMHLMPGCVDAALKMLGYKSMAEVKPEHQPVFATAFDATNPLSPEAHIKMVAACQPFISGGISKTINLPSSATVQDVEDAYLLAWKLGLKSISVYRDGSKGSQPINQPKTADAPKPTVPFPAHPSPESREVHMQGVHPLLAAPFPAHRESNGTAVTAPFPAHTRPYRKHLPDERQSVTHKFDIAGHDGYLTVGLYPDGAPGEVFVTMSKQGSTIAGLMDAWAIEISISLQYGVPLQAIIDKHRYTRFEPSGFTKCAAVPFAHSVVDYVVGWLDFKFGSAKTHEVAPILKEIASGVEPFRAATLEATTVAAPFPAHTGLDTHPCRTCGALMVRQGTCYVCQLCGSQDGSC